MTTYLARHRLPVVAMSVVLFLGAFFALPQGQAAASALLVLFRGTGVQGFSTDIDHLKNAQAAFNELQQLGSVSGKLPTSLTSVGSVAQAQAMTKLSLPQPSSFPSGVNHTPTAVRAVAASGMSITFNKAKADAYFKQHGSSVTMPAQYDGATMTANFPAVAIVEYGGNGRLYVGEAGQPEIDVSPNTIDPNQLRSYLLSMPTLSKDTASALSNLTNWQSTIPLGVPTDKAGWRQAQVQTGSYQGFGVRLDDNTGIGSAIIWQVNNGAQTLGVGGYGLKATDVQSIAGSLH